MLGLHDLEIGLMFWAGEDARASLRQVTQFGLRAGQLGFPGELPLKGAAERWDEALTAEHFTAVTAFCSYLGEDYTDIRSVARTVGLVPAGMRAERVTRTKEVSAIARALAIDSVACHLGFVPDIFESRTTGTRRPVRSEMYQQVRDVTRELCDYCGANGQSFTLETGQEPAKVLLQFMADVDRPNLKINFDPANMILYGTGDPIEALEALAKHVISVHCKDGDWPPMDRPDALGEERPLGEGSVDFPAFISKLKELGYKGVLSIERENIDEPQRSANIRKAIAVLRRLTERERRNAV